MLQQGEKWKYSSLEITKQRYALVGEICPHCEAKIFPPRDVCPYCSGEAKTSYQSAGRVKCILIP